ncbi:MAG: pyridoxamine 5'-phosphate oxidase family protein [Paludibacter sp.]|nr:pyridoxamine 5'-phosphate oxidase family protein [Paludibacter sp.]
MKTLEVINKEEIESIINGCHVCFVGINNSDDCPYVIPMNFAYADGFVYLHSAPLGTHVKLLDKNPKVSITFCLEGKLVYQDVDVACSYRMKSKSVICNGEVEFVEDLDRKEEYLNLLMRKYTRKSFNFSLPALKNVKVWKVNLIKVSAKAFGQKHF